ncbi:O-antigen ligase family protein [Thioclava pacifica]|uniref:O-antigen ligase family protein n=1 Tax=Thioclava pacifica TaxID=285109 RepID=UPI0012FA1A77|nr:O-antigen ligase family protein [Thioclava pacifica]
MSELLRWVVLFFGVLMALRFKFRRGGFQRGISTTIDFVLVVVLALFLLSSLWSIDAIFSAQKAVSMTLLIITSFWTLWRYADSYSEERLLNGLLFTVVGILAANVTLGWFLGNPMLVGRFRGFFLNPNNIGILAAVAGGLSLVRWLDRMTWKNFLAVAIVMSNLVLAGSRASMLSIGLVTFFYIGRSLLASRARGTLFGFLLAAGGLWFFQTDFFVTRILRAYSLADASNRIYFWSLAKNYIAHRWWLGHGFGTDIIIHDYYGVVLSDLGLRGAGVMSSYYGLGVQIGIPLTVTFFALVWGYVLGALFIRFQYAKSYVYAAIVAGGLVVAIFEPVLFSAGNAFSFLFVVVFMLLVRRETYRRRGISLGPHGELAKSQPAGLKTWRGP